ncbi:GGDEF domain-containing protein [Marinomonas ostreistagni]|uniref:GGDEF domain-containing protein n=1 Tax=Marinomonas ostreistagni TaxID=359209 RepID=A0ABS0ZAZ6_9GAMM|nr:GGDEF domain-containing protein [Marinomonas ostreistagni]MBJ7550403.1 GGDEF domain-containing protein [Marinomonas ostreistagni]
MDIGIKDTQINEALHESLLQRDFLLQLRKADQKVLEHVANSASFIIYVEQIISSIQALFPSTLKPCVLWCDEELTQWRVMNYQDWPGLGDSLGSLPHVPQSLATFVASPSRSFARETNLVARADWSRWQDFLAEHFIDTCDMVSIQDDQKNWFTFCLFSPKFSSDYETQTHYWALEQVLHSIPQWIKAMVTRCQTDITLQQHTNEITGLLQPHAFAKALDMMLRDARRYFQRLAFVSVLVSEEAEEDELKLLSDILRETLRDNDLLANVSDHEFVMAMRISQLDDAPVVAEKVQSALLKADPSQISALSGGVKIGVALYPEQANHDKLYFASVAAANAVTESMGYRLEYYGKFVKDLDEAYGA